MAQIILLPEEHIYQVDGEVVPSVSELTRFISREIYRDVDQRFLEIAADRGTAVHKATEVLDKFRKAEVDEVTAPFLKAYVKYLKETNPEYQKIEWSVCHPDRLYCGTIDRVFTDADGKHHIVDIKTTANIDKGHKTVYTAQLSLYQLAVAAEFPDAQLEILQLKKDETFKLIPLEFNEPLAMACITIHEALKKKPRRKKDAG